MRAVSLNQKRKYKMRIKIFIIVFLVFRQFHLSGQDSLVQKVQLLEHKLENTETSINLQVERSNHANDRAKETLEYASKLVDWTGMFFAAITVIFLIASIVGFREFAEIRALKNNLKEQQDKIQIELSDIEKIKREILADNTLLRNRIESESKDFLKIIYLTNQGVNNYHAGKLYDAEATFQEILKINPNDYRALCYLARSFFGQEKYNLALDTISKATILDEKSQYAYTIMGEMHRMVGRIDDAIFAFNKAINIEAKPSSYSSLGYAYLKKGDYENAISSFQAALQFRRYSTPSCGLAKAYLKSKQESKANKYFHETVILAEEEIKKGSIYIWPHYNLTFALLILNKKTDCLKALKLALERNSNMEVLKEQLEEYTAMMNEDVPKPLLSDCIKQFERKILELST